MATSSKGVFEPDTFAPEFFAPGVFRGTGPLDVPPDVSGRAQHTLPDRQGYTLPDRQGYTLPEAQ